LPNQLTAQEIEDWFANPITELFYKHIDKAIADNHEAKTNAFAPGDPQTTQERHAWHLGAEWAFGQITDMRDDKHIGAEDDIEFIGH
jgi:hypothetical protein